MIIENFKPLSLDFVFRRTSISFDAFDLRLQIDEKYVDMQVAYNSDLIHADRNQIVYLSHQNKQIKKRPIYLYSRNIYERKIGNDLVHMDFLIYNNDIVFDGVCVNRSKGHVNDVDEMEIFQVLRGRIFCLFIDVDNKKHYGVFEEGDYYHVPNGWYHCTYILDGPAIVANFYMRTFWETDLEKKPYFVMENKISIEKKDGEITIKERGGGTMGMGEIAGKYAEYRDISNDFYSKISKYLDKSIFELFFSDCYIDL